MAHSLRFCGNEVGFWVAWPFSGLTQGLSGGMYIFQPRWITTWRILGGGQDNVMGWCLLSSLGTSRILLDRTSCWETTHASGHQCAWPRWLVLINGSLTFSSVQFSRSVVSDSLQPHESQPARPPCPSRTPRVHPDSSPSSQWCHPAISSSVIPFSSCPQSLPASESNITDSQRVGLMPIPMLSLHSVLSLILET